MLENVCVKILWQLIFLFKMSDFKMVLFFYWGFRLWIFFLLVLSLFRFESYYNIFTLVTFFFSFLVFYSTENVKAAVTKGLRFFSSVTYYHYYSNIKG